MRTSQTGGDGKLSFRQAERHMTEYTEYIFKMEAYVSTLDPGWNGGEILRAAATGAHDMDDDEVTNVEAIFWNVSALNSDHHDQARLARLFVGCCKRSGNLASNRGRS